jgi:hypothetical protein
LQHHFRDEHVPRVSRCTPRKVPQTRDAPGKEWFLDQSQAALVSYGRLRSGALARFHTITRRRK